MDKEVAFITGRRHGKPVVLTVESGKMSRDGYKLYLSNCTKHNDG